MNTQPEALRLADWLDEAETDYLEPLDHVAAELRRLHALNADLLHALYTALPFIEDALDDATYSREKVRAKLDEIKAVICKAGSA